MAPTSYRPPLEGDDQEKHTHSQTFESNTGMNQPGITVEAILAHKGDDIFTVAPHTTVKEVIAELNRLRVGALVVIDSAKEPVGIVTERDIVRNADTKGAASLEGTAEDIMTASPRTCTPADKVETVMKLMMDHNFRHMPVLEDGKLRSVVSIRDVVRHRMQEIEYENLKIKQAMVG